MRYTRDGGVVPAGIPISQRKRDKHYSQFGLKKGNIVDVIFPEDPRNSSGERVEYVVRVDGQNYPNAVCMETRGAVYNYSERIRKKIEKSFTRKIDKDVYDENLDGEIVYVLFLSGHGDHPIIIGSGNHPRHGAYKKLKKDDGNIDVDEFNGVEVKIDKNSNWQVTQLGRKDPDGKILNPAAVGAKVVMKGNGDIVLDTHGTESLSDLNLQLLKSAKTWLLQAQGNKFTGDASGIIMEDKNGNITTKNSSGIVFEDLNGNKVTMSAAGIEMEDANGNKITMSASGININSSANLVKIDGSVYGAHKHVGNGGVPTPPPLDANTE